MSWGRTIRIGWGSDAYDRGVQPGVFASGDCCACEGHASGVGGVSGNESGLVRGTVSGDAEMKRADDVLLYISNCLRFTGRPPARIVLSAKELAEILRDARFPADMEVKTFNGIPVVIEG